MMRVARGGMAMILSVEFEKAAQHARSLPSQSDEVLLELYGLYKQATAGDASGDGPGMFDFVGRAKFEAWAAVRGTSREAAMRAYVDRVESLARG
jgi:diazepam-binding inhibitor (GABA receptor modulator, acyl-CoA-binding protein)